MEKTSVWMTIFVVLLACSIFLQVGLAMFKTTEPKNVALICDKKREDLPSSNEVNIVRHDCLHNFDHSAGQRAINQLPDSQTVSACGLHALEKKFVAESSQQFLAEPLQEGHAILYSIDVTNDVYEGGNCYVQLTVYNIDAGTFGADLYLIYWLYDKDGALREIRYSLTYYVGRGNYKTFDIEGWPLADPNNPVLPPGSNTIIIDLYWDDWGNPRWQDQTWVTVGVAAVTPDWHDNGYTDPSVVYDDQYTDITCYAEVYDYSGLTERGFGYKFTGTSWSSYTKWTDYIPGGTHWFSHPVPRSTWINHVGERLSFRWYAYDYWGLYAQIEFLEWTEIRDDDTTLPQYSSPSTSPSGTVYDSHSSYIRLQINWQDSSGIYEVKFKYRYGSGSWTSWLSPTGSSGSTYWYDIQRSDWINHVGQTIDWKSSATDNDNDRSGDRLTYIPSTFDGPAIEDDDHDGPNIYSVQVQEYNGDGDWVIEDDEQVKISWSLSDPSGIYSTSCTVDGNSPPVQGSYYVICGPYAPDSYSFVISATDNDNDRSNDRASSSYPGSFSVSDDDPDPPSYSNVYTSPSGTVYDSYNNYVRLGVDWEDPSGIYEVRFRYRYGSGSWSAWLPPTGSSGKSYWYDIPRSDWMNHIDQTIYWESYATDDDNDRSGDRLTQYTSTFTGPTIRDDDTVGPSFSNPCPMDDIYDDYTGSYRVAIDVSDLSEIYAVEFAYRFDGGEWSCCHPYSGYSGNTYWYDIPREVWVQHVGETIYWQVDAEDNDNDRPGDRASSTSAEYPGGTIYDDDAIGPNIFDPWDSGDIYDDNLNDYRLQISATDPSGVSAVKFRYRFNSGSWSAWLPPTGSSGDTYWHDISRVVWIEYVDQTIEWEAQAIDNDNDRANDQATSYSPTYVGGNISDDDTTGPLISNPFSSENETTGLYRIQVNVSDPSGIYNVQFRYKFGAGSWHGWYDYAGSADDIYWYDIPESEWTGHIGETMYWEAYTEDYDNDRDNDRATTIGPTYEAIIGQYQITFQQSGCTLPVNATIDDKNYTLPATFFWNKSSSHSISVPEIINNTETGYEFVQWNDGNTSSSRTIIVTGAATYTAYYTPIGVHDVSVVNVTLSKTIVGQGYCTNITVTVENQGDFEETFNVTTYYCSDASVEQKESFHSIGDVNRDGYIDETDKDILADNYGWTGPPGSNPADINSDGSVDTLDAIILKNHLGLNMWTYFNLLEPIETQTVSLTSGSSMIITFIWNTTSIPKGNYPISAYAHPVPGETDTTDNTLIDGWVVVTIPGDVDGDFDVDIYDIVKICLAYGSKKGDPRYDANCDIDGDGDVDIYDVTIACTHYGQKDP